MKSAPFPPNESERLAALATYSILDTLPEQDYDEISRIAAEICQTPVALISLMDADRQWFKSCYGIQVTEAPRALSPCAHTILVPDDLLIVPDTAEDERFFDNPMIVGPPNIRFYAGVPLVSADRFVLGTLCVMDLKPSALSGSQARALRALAHQVMNQLELRRKNAELEKHRSDLLLTNEALREAKQNAEEATHTKARFLSVMSHEIRTPLHAIIGYTNMLLEEHPRPDQAAYLRILQFSGQTLLSLLNDILDFSKLEAGKVALEQIPFSLCDLIRNIVNLNNSNAQLKSNRILVDADDRIPEQLMGDPTRLIQIFNNLVSNAIKFTDSGDIGVRTDLVRQDALTTTLHFEVSDTGIGIAPEAAGRIFDEFSQASTSTTRKFGGTGLGLSITRRLLTLMDSQIYLRSTVGRGSVFSFDITFHNVAESAHNTQRPVAADLTGFRVLIVDDNELNLMILSHCLTSKGIDVQSFTSPLEALRVVASGAFDLAMVDLQMPEMNGYELGRAIRGLCPDLPVAVLSADNSRQTHDEALREGMNAYLAKPYSSDKLDALLAQFLVRV